MKLSKVELMRNILKLRNVLKFGAFVLTAVLMLGCSEPPEKTQDPAEIEELRKEHGEMAQRELEDMKGN